MMLRALLVVATGFLPAAQEGSTKPAAASDAAVAVPTWPNATCPIMGKPISSKLFVDTDYGRIYVCCKGCNKKILADVGTAYKAAYPRTQKLGNAICPVSGRRVAEKATSVLLQGQEVALCCPDCVKPAKESAQVVLAKATRPELVDVGNEICPITSKPIDKNSFVVVGDRLVRLSGPECVEDVKKDPKATLDRAVQSRAAAAGRKDG